CSLACAPNCTTCEESMRAVEDARAVPGPELPVYQATVLADPFTSEVAVPNGGPETRSGVAVAVPPGKPSAAKAAAFVLVTDSVDALLPFSVTTPPVTVDGVVVPVSASTFESNV